MYDSFRGNRGNTAAVSESTDNCPSELYGFCAIGLLAASILIACTVLYMRLHREPGPDREVPTLIAEEEMIGIEP